MPQASVTQFVHQQLFEKLRPAFICVDPDFKLLEQSDNLGDYGFAPMALGDTVSEHLDFLVGMDSRTQLDLPMVESPNGTPLSVSLIPADQRLTILFTNVSDQAQQRQELQQIANENELLLRQQRILTQQLEAASKELEHTNTQLLEATRLQNSFLSGVSHEFRTPLTSIIGYTELLRKTIGHSASDTEQPHLSAGGAADSEDYLRAVDRSSKHLLSLVENLLDQGKLDSNEIVIRPKSCDLYEIVDDVCLLMKPLAQDKNVDFELRSNLVDSTQVIADDSRLRQCLVNLLGNAIKFTDQGKVSLHLGFNEEQLSVKIVDTGCGIAADELEKIRIPFFQGSQTGKVGTGLGLSITDRLIELLGGQLNIESELGKGTEVSFCIPLPELQEPSPSVQGSTEIVVNSLKVLLAEDDADIADLVWMLLVERGFDVTHVSNGVAALDEIQKTDFDLVLMDIHMPIMDGYEAMAQLQEQNNTVPVVVMSASNLEADRSLADSLGCAAYLTKPVDIDDLVQLTKQLLT